MNRGHLVATLWLRWRILANRVQRASKLGNVLLVVLLVLGLCVSLGAFALALVLGIKWLPETDPMSLMFSWIALTLGFLFFWTAGLITDLQRSDAMSFKSLLHLPVSLSWVFLYNYLSSFVSVSIALFLPAMLGLWLAMVITGGAAMLLLLPLLLGFFGMVTAVTYQLRGWLARLMENKRRGRNIVALITFSFIALIQVPNLINMSNSSSDRDERRQARAESRELRRAAEREGPGQATAEAALARLAEEEAQEIVALDRNVSLVAQIVPVGWMAYGMRAGFEGRWFQGALFTLGLLGIMGASLRRSYRTTIASVVGGGGAEVATVARPSSSTVARDAGPTALLVERSLPPFGERESGIALAVLRSLMRAPEAKMMLLSPIIMFALFGAMFVHRSSEETLSTYAPMLSLAAISLGLLSIQHLLQNQFGLDRAGFRAFVLSPVPRYRILIGKNLATAPLGLGVGLVGLIGLQFFAPVDAAHALGALFQLLSAYVLMCLVGNMASILGPLRLKDHGLKAANAKFHTVLLQLLSMVLVPTVLSPLLLPAAVEWLFPLLGVEPLAWLYPLLHALGLAGVILVYRWSIQRQGALLQSREQRILEVLTRS